MCPPSSERHSREGVSRLYAAWMNQLQHGPQHEVCFPCFKAAFLKLKATLQAEPWADAEGATGPGQPVPGGPADPAPEELEQLGFNQELTPTELGPQDAAPLGLGPEDTDWMQALPWRFGELPSCPHWPGATFQSQRARVELLPGKPMVLKLDDVMAATQMGAVAQAKACLLELQFMSMAECVEASYFWRMTPRWTWKAPDGSWMLVLDPNEAWGTVIPSVIPDQDVPRWRLSVLESLPTGDSAELVPAEVALRKRGFTILSYSPWVEEDAEMGDAACSLQASTQGQGPSSPEIWGSEPWGEPRDPEMRD